MNRAIMLGGRTFDVPTFVLRHNVKIYPLCRKLVNDGLVERVAASGQLDYSEDDMTTLAEVAFLAANAAEPVSRDEFDALPVTPAELFDAFIAARYQTGGWAAVEKADDAGEQIGAARPRRSTSTASSPA